MNTILKKIKNTTAQSTVEFALVLPVLLLILLGIMEFGRLMETTNILSSAAREGARVAAVTAPDQARVQEAANNILSAGNITGATITVSGPNTNQEITVTVQIIYTPITGSFIPGLSSLELSRTTRMRWEG